MRRRVIKRPPRPILYAYTENASTTGEPMSRESRLHIPRPPARPGAKPDFSYLATSPAGAVKRPDVNANTRDIEFLSTEMVRVLDEQHTAVGPWNPHLDAPDLQIGLRHMVLTRIFDDRMLRIQRQGKISFYMKCTGEEAVAVAQCMALRPADMLFPSYRVQGALIDGFDSTTKSMRTLFPGARLGYCLRHALNKLPDKLVGLAAPVRQG